MDHIVPSAVKAERSGFRMTYRSSGKPRRATEDSDQRLIK